ncbi:MAG: uroporphyrinogen decarboxylase family protein [Kiritimatiellae bacterium]|nr:uroporphyrinogen decarboxylase family protein [Kiritimatiellia bacterium]
MTPRQRVEIALKGGHGVRVPFTMYETMIPQCAAEREMRNRGLCIVKRVDCFKTHRPNVKTYSHTFYENHRQLVRHFYETPYGVLTTLHEPSGFTSWALERMYKKPDDYKAMLFFIKDEVYEPDYEHVASLDKTLGEDVILRAGIGGEPLQSLVSGPFFDTAQFCLEWMDHRDELMKLYDAIAAKRRSIYKLVADAPVLHANYGGNVTPEIIGLEMFRQYYVPHYNEAAEILHKKGKLIGCHFDANCKLFADAIAKTRLDYIEAFTPAPDTDMRIADARQAWSDKVIWLNFPSSVHLKPDGVVEQTTVDLLDQAESIDGLIMGITEDIPPDRWQNSCRAVMEGLDRHARQRPELYRD